ncbi:sulfotransferase [Dyella sp. A6]|uniref:sulfotransferase family protein n=1 Tax=Dyella aluminiiresistens TaxID=3069105 RepID=UPI002E77FC76|nr:sulfotransferase [Dyella sp. A6]
MQRIFIVGCPRSGTTLVQAMLARHPSIFTLPETAFFEGLFTDLKWRWGDPGARNRPPRPHHRLGMARSGSRRAFRELQSQLLGTAPERVRVPWRVRTCTRQFVDTLDRMATDAQRSAWIEKTPNHLLYIPEIEAAVPDARFIHVIRRGMDVVASLTDATLRFNALEAFDGSVALWTHRWNRAMQIHREHAGQAHHHFVFLEDLQHDSASTWRNLCQFLDLPANAQLADNCQQSIADLGKEPWKHAALAGVPKKPERKVDELFGPRIKRWLQSNLLPYEELRTSCLVRSPRY